MIKNLKLSLGFVFLAANLMAGQTMIFQSALSGEELARVEIPDEIIKRPELNFLAPEKISKYATDFTGLTEYSAFQELIPGEVKERISRYVTESISLTQYRAFQELIPGEVKEQVGPAVDLLFKLEGDAIICAMNRPSVIFEKICAKIKSYKDGTKYCSVSFKPNCNYPPFKVSFLGVGRKSEFLDKYASLYYTKDMIMSLASTSQGAFVSDFTFNVFETVDDPVGDYFEFSDIGTCDDSITFYPQNQEQLSLAMERLSLSKLEEHLEKVKKIIPILSAQSADKISEKVCESFVLPTEMTRTYNSIFDVSSDEEYILLNQGAQLGGVGRSDCVD